jgi:hypothetical protein
MGICFQAKMPIITAPTDTGRREQEGVLSYPTNKPHSPSGQRPFFGLPTEGDIGHYQAGLTGLFTASFLRRLPSPGPWPATLLKW